MRLSSKLAILLCAFTSLACADTTSTTSAPGKKLNVLFIAIDDLRPELNCYGTTFSKSPNIDKLASQGLQFNRAYCQLALCNPSRSSLLTGRRPETLGIYELNQNIRDSDPNVVTLPQLFKNNGYISMSYGKIFHTGNGNHNDPASWSISPWDGGPDPDYDDVDNTPEAPKPSKKVKKEKRNDRKDAKAEKASAAARAKKEAGISPEKPAHKKEKPRDPHNTELPYGAPDVADDQLLDGKIANQAIHALQENKDKPFFLGVGFHRPHLPFVSPKKYWDMFDANTLPLAPNPFLPEGAPEFASNNASEIRRYMNTPKEGPLSDELSRKLIHGYLASVAFTDAQVGKVINELDRLGLRDNTIIVLWGDHGYQLGEHGTWTKRTNWEIATRVPLIISTPDNLSAGEKTNALVELVDLYPTLAEMCGLKAPEKLEGTSLLPLLKDSNTAWKKAAFSVYQKEIPGMGLGLGRAVVNDRYRLVEWSDPKSDKKIYELYDHQVDPQENHNIADKPESKTILDTMTKLLHSGWQGAKP